VVAVHGDALDAHHLGSVADKHVLRDHRQTAGDARRHAVTGRAWKKDFASQQLQ
jgi:hypothetical protein